jgi:hypothetical protein
MRTGRRKLAEKQCIQDQYVPGFAVAAAGTQTSGSASSLASVEPCRSREGLLRHRITIASQDRRFAEFGQLVSEYVKYDMAYRLPADHLLSLIYYNVFRACVSNIQRLGLSFEEMCLDEYQSKFPTMAPDDPSLQLLPPDLRPTQLQRRIPHHPMWDILPSPTLRDNVLTYGEDSLDDTKLCFEIMGDGSPASGEEASERAGLIAWSDPSQASGWEVTEKFAKNWSFLLKGARELELSTNRWRAARMEDPIFFAML